MKLLFRDHKQAFEDAIYYGRLSDDPRKSNYAGHYMYMHSGDGHDYFKRIDNRSYLEVPMPEGTVLP